MFAKPIFNLAIEFLSKFIERVSVTHQKLSNDCLQAFVVLRQC